jgi:lipopolysaccharide transport system ATP-binding protein
MSKISLSNATVDFPVFNVNSRSFKKRFLQIATGGSLNAESNGVVIVRALDDITLELNDGDRVGLFGHNGAGKSTLLRLITGVYPPTSGTRFVEGKIGSLINIGLGLDAEATGRENVYLRGALLGLSRSQISSVMDEVIAFSDLGSFIDLPLRTYSTGMALRLTFAISTSIRPEILVMDEWLSVGDEAFQDKAEDRLAQLLDRTNILVIASHSRALLSKTCNKVVILEHGKIKSLLPINEAHCL